MSSTPVKRTAAVLFGAFVFFGLLIAVGQIDPDGSSNALASLGIAMGIPTVFIVVVLVIIGIPLWVIHRRRNRTASTLRRIAGSVAGTLMAYVWLINIMILVLILYATVIGTMQIALFGFLLGSPIERHFHLIAIVLTIMTLFGFGTTVRGVWGHRIVWDKAIWHGMKSALVCGLLAYAGLVLATSSWELLKDNPDWARANQWIVFVFAGEIMMIIVGTTLLMLKEVEGWPTESESIGSCHHRSRFVMWIKNLGLRWNIIRIWQDEDNPTWVSPSDSWFRIRIRKGLRWNMNRERLPRYRNNSDWPLFP